MAAVAVVLAGLLCAAPMAWSASVSESATTLSFKGGAEQNIVTITQSGDSYLVTDEAAPAIQDETGTCTAQAPNSLLCPAPSAPGPTPIAVNLGPGDDSVRNETSTGSSLSGRDGNDILVGGSGKDIFDGGTGDDRLVTNDGIPEIVKCGTGTDSFLSDSGDVVSDCEDNGVPPDTTITGGPAPVVNPGGNPVEFTFSATESPATFTCRLDQQVSPDCASPFQTGLLDEGNYTFGVTAIDQYGHADPTEASRSFTVDLTSPNTSITAGPSGTIDTRTPTFELSSSESPPNFVCEIDDGPIIACRSPFTLPALENGAHRFRAWAQDAAGNLDQTGASRSFTVDATGVVPKAESPPVVIVLGSIVLISGHTVKMSHSGTVPVTLVCAGAKPCKGTMQLTTADPVRTSAKKIVKLGQRRFQIKPQGKARIKVRLGKKRMAMVRKLRRVKTRATIREVDLRGNPRISMRTFTLRGR